MIRMLRFLAVFTLVACSSSEVSEQLVPDASLEAVLDGSLAQNGDASLCGTDFDMAGCFCRQGETRDCFVGPAEIAGIGACTMGTQTCNVDRGEFSYAWSACEGSGEPTRESCNKVDDDCNDLVDDGVTCAQCIAPGEEPVHSGGLIGKPYTHCISDAEEAKGLHVGRTITASDTDVHWSLTSLTKQCCNSELQVVDFTTDFCLHGAWRIVCR